MIARLIRFHAPLMAILVLLLCSVVATGQEPLVDGGDREGSDRVQLFDSLESPTQSMQRSSRMSVAELRQARALYRANQRVARMEYNLWMGHEPLRPNWNATPMTSSRYGNRQVFIPLYIYPR